MNTMRQALIVGLLMVLAQPADAQLNPSRQITIVVPIGAGGGVDATGRLIAEKLQERLKQPVVVENRPAARRHGRRRLRRQGRARRPHACC